MNLRKLRYGRYSLVLKTLNLEMNFEPLHSMRLSKKAVAISDMKIRTFAEVKRKGDEKARRQRELAELQSEIEMKLKSGEIELPK